MTIFLDLAGSLIIRASMVTVLLGLTVTMNNALYETTQRTNAAGTIATVGEIIYTDLNQTVASGFTTSNGNRMVFQADTSMGGGHLATIIYDATESYTSTQWDPVTQSDVTTTMYRLYRQTGSDRVIISDNLLSASFSYFDANGHTTTSPGNVDAIRVKLVAKVEGVNTGLTTALNDFKVTPPNIN